MFNKNDKNFYFQIKFFIFAAQILIFMKRVLKKILKIIGIVVVILALAGGGFLGYMKWIFKPKTFEAFNLIPQNTIFVVETTDLSQAWTTISNSHIWKYLLQSEYFKDIDQNLQMLDKYLKENKMVASYLKNRKLLFSSHLTAPTTLDFLFVIDLQSTSILSGKLSSMLQLVPDLKIATRKFNETEIIELQMVSNPKMKIYLAAVENVLVGSFSDVLLEKSISESKNSHWQNNSRFQKTVVEAGEKKLFTFYFQYSQLNSFSKTFLTEENNVMSLLSTSLAYSVLTMNIEKEILSFKGITSLDSISSYIKVLARSKRSKMRAFEWLSSKTALYFSMCFENFNEFYKNLRDEYKTNDPKSLQELDGNIQLAESFLGINIQNDFFNWIGNEIAFVKLSPSAKTREIDVVAAIHSNNLSDAKTGLEKIMTQIRKRSPVKFETVKYKNFDINYLEIKGFFRVFLGKMFDNLEKPFFTYIEDYVVFSNSMEVVKQLVDDYLNGKTLSHSKEFSNFKDNFENKSNLTLFIQMPQIYQHLYFYSNAEKRVSVQKNKELILSFARLGFQLSSENSEQFRTTFLAEHDTNSLIDSELEKIENETSDELFNYEYDSLKFKVPLTLAELEKNGAYKVYFPDSAKVKFEGNISNNKLNGLWRGFYENGNVMSTVIYKDGKADGEAFFYYDANPSVKKAVVKFKDDKIIGQYQEFHPNGAQKAKIEYDDAQMHGDAEFYYPSGRIKMQGEYKNGKKHSKWKIFDENGELISKEKWKKGEKKN